MSMQSRSEEISREPAKWKAQNPTAVLVTIKRGVLYYGFPENNEPFYAIADNRVYKTTFYGLDDVEIYGGVIRMNKYIAEINCSSIPLPYDWLNRHEAMEYAEKLARVFEGSRVYIKNGDLIIACAMYGREEIPKGET